MNLAVCTIVRDEEPLIEGYIHAVQKFAQELVVVDTGSRDLTVERAEKLGVKVSHFAWNNNFADARNFSIQQATQPWILVMDPDEYLPEDSISGLERLLQKGYHAYQVVVRNRYPIPMMTLSLDVPALRLFRRSKEIFFEGRVHEDIRQSLFRLTYEPAISDLVIVHRGYEMTDFYRIFRNQRLFEAAHHAYPTDVWIQFHLALGYSLSGDLEKAIKLVQLLLSIPDEQIPSRTRAYLLSLAAYWALELGNTDVARRDAIRASHALGGDNVVSEYVLGLAEQREGNLKNALEHFHNIEKLQFTAKETEIKIDALYKQIAALYFKMGNFARSLQYVELARREYPSYEVLTLGGLAAEKLGQFSVALRLYREAQRYTDDPGALRQRIEYCERKASL